MREIRKLGDIRPVEFFFMAVGGSIQDSARLPGRSSNAVGERFLRLIGGDRNESRGYDNKCARVATVRGSVVGEGLV
ncbi:MAG TPA: hypothetical protein DDZ51_25070 [Planctomycetaceae bacterium]|nr:hypothetical protein [Planctomycetaceae bacterium]